MSDDADRIGALLTRAALEMDSRPGLTDTLEVGLAWCLRVVEGCDMAGVTLRRARGRVETAACTHEAVRRCDALQYDLNEGPCLDAIAEVPTVHSGDVGHELERWPQWGPRVSADDEVHSMLSVRLFTSGRVFGALNMYSHRKAAFDADSIAHGTLYASHLAVAMHAAMLTDELVVAVDSRNLIGQAQGILMERLGLDAEQAFSVLNRVSQHTNTKLIEVARRVVTKREVPGVEPTVAASLPLS